MRAFITRAKTTRSASAYKPIDVAAQRAEAALFESRTALFSQRLKTIKQVSSAQKKRAVIATHQTQWVQTLSRLAERCCQVESELYGMILGQCDLSVDERLEMQGEWAQLASAERADRAALLDYVSALRARISPHMTPDTSAQLGARLSATHQAIETGAALLERDLAALEAELAAEPPSALTDLAGELLPAGLPPRLAEAPCADETLREDCAAAFNALDSRYRAALLCAELESASALATPHGGWEATEALHFAKLYDEYDRANPSWRRLFFERAALEMPQRSRAELLAHESWRSRRAFVQAQQRALRTSWAAARADLEQRAAASLEESLREADAQRARSTEAQRLQRVRARLARQLAAWAEARAAQEAREAEQASAAAARQAAEEAALARQIAEQRESQRIALEAYHARQAAAAEAEAALAAAQQVEREARDAETAARNAERVRFRESEYEARLARAAEARAAAERAVVERERRLDALRASVAVHAAPDEERLRGLTIAAAAAAGQAAYSDGGRTHDGGLFPTPGYSDAQIMSDQRARVAHALSEAGLQRSHYGRAMILSAAPATVPRPDTFSTAERSSLRAG